MFKRALSGGDGTYDTMSQARLLAGSGLLGGAPTGSPASALGSLNSINLQSHLTGAPNFGAATTSATNPLLGLLLKQALNNNGNNTSNLPSSIDLLLARQNLLMGGAGQNSGIYSSSLLTNGSSLGTLANAAQRLEPSLTRTNSSNSSSSSAVSQAIRKRTSGRLYGTIPLDKGDEEAGRATKRRRLSLENSCWEPSCQSSTKAAKFPLPPVKEESEINTLPKLALKEFHSKWRDLDKKLSSFKTVKTETEKAEFMREMFARSLRDGTMFGRSKDSTSLKKKSNTRSSSSATRSSKG